MSINIRISFNIFTNRMQWKWMNYCYMPQHRRISENNTEMKRPHIKSKYYMIPFTWSTKAGQMIHDIWNNDSSYLRKEVGTKWGKGDFCSASNMIFLDLSVVTWDAHFMKICWVVYFLYNSTNFFEHFYIHYA